MKTQAFSEACQPKASESAPIPTMERDVPTYAHAFKKTVSVDAFPNREKYPGIAVINIRFAPYMADVIIVPNRRERMGLVPGNR